MNKSELIEAIAQDTEMTRAIVKKILDSFLQRSTQALKNGEPVVLMGFGGLYPWEQNERIARNPKTGVPVMIQPRMSVKFRIGSTLLDELNE